MSEKTHRSGMDNPSPGRAGFIMTAHEIPADMEKELKPGDLLQGRYKIRSEIGRGAYGVVYLAEDIVVQGAVWAVKEISESSLSEEERSEAVALFKSEAELLQSLNHTGVPKTVDSFSLGNLHYLVMEYIEGESLDDIVARKPLSPEEAVSFAIKLCGILDYLHTRRGGPVIFRDLKPSNVMVTKRGRVILVDFGTARLFNPQKTRDTVCLGTPGFCAPEQYGVRQSDPRSDIYGLGATLYYLLTLEDLRRHNFHPPGASKLNPSVSGALEALIAKAMEIDMEKRISTAAEMQKELQRLKDIGAITSSHSTAPAQAHTPVVTAAPVPVQIQGTASAASAASHAQPTVSTSPLQQPLTQSVSAQAMFCLSVCYLLTLTGGLFNVLASVASSILFFVIVTLNLGAFPLNLGRKKYTGAAVNVIVTLAAILMNIHYSRTCMTIPGTGKVGLFLFLFSH
jgi:serine/threonine protein kinase